MATTMRETAPPPVRSSSHWRWAPISPKAIVAMLIGLVVAFLVGHALSPTRHVVTTAQSALPGPTRLGALGIPVGYPDTQAGAVSAAVNLDTASLTPAGRDPANRDVLLSVIATPAGKSLIGDGLKAQDAQLTAWFGSPTAPYSLAGTIVATKVERFTPTKAVVDLWGVITTSHPGVPLASAFWGGQRVTLEWDGDWKADSMDATLSVPIPSSQGAAGDPNTLLGGFTSDRLYTGARP
jgi:hypothetical protein